MKVVLLVVLVAVELVSAQKLFFRSHKELQLGKDKNVKKTGFGFKEPRHYFTSRLTAKEMAADGAEVGVVTCPDGKSACPTGQTCCLMATKAYGCCAMPQAVCCQDGKHCCPFRSKCDILRQMCTQGEMEIPWSMKKEAFLISELEGQSQTESTENLEGDSVMCPDGAHMCPDGTTCCKQTSGEWGCCPIPKAVCCSDGLHCCPQGYTCDVQHSKCNKQDGSHTTELFRKLPAKTNSANQMVKLADPSVQEAILEGVMCDKSHMCPTGNTCCRLDNGDWGCCPIANAVCCSDHLHCCPEDTTCDTGAGKCNRGNMQIDWLEKKPAQHVGKVRCDATRKCADGQTCCKTSTGGWGCCPLPKAVCCSDKVHCCPEATTCDVSAGKCNRGNTQIDWFEKRPAQQVGAVPCPDGKSQCPSGDTCCMLSSGQYGCCPLPKAVCCADHLHCCPEGTTCDTGAGKCDRGNTQIDWFEKRPAQQVGAVPCPDGKSQCPSGDTCCMLSSGQYGCCPLPKAVCCADHLHCCPEGTTCDTGAGKCDRGNTQIDWFEKRPAQQVGAVPCPDGKSQCPSGDTCCMLSSGQYGCCPLPKAVCCADHLHCCPEGTTCDTGAGKCDRGNTQIDWFEKRPAQQVGAVPCPDGKSQCPSGDTCCMLSSGQYGCCPLPKAVCCADHLHCCPEGTTCDTGAGKCDRGNTQIDWFEKRPAQQVGAVPCPDGKSQCPSGDTCCMLSSGQYGCCPLPKAVCCADHLHCCPEGTTCDTGAGKCDRGNTQIDWFEKRPAQQVGAVPCPDGKSQCPSGDTCCMLSSGQYGCCPLPKAVCCSDHLHCCPEGTTCDTGAGKCDRGNTQIDWFEKRPAQQVGAVPCPDGKSQCPSGDTCCMLSSGQYGCCPLPKAVCCADHLHCCPEGTTCDTGAGKCDRGNTQIDWFEKRPAQQVGAVPCPDGKSQCPSGDTCCMLSSGQYGCCPLPKAVCCSDHLHCCPEGTTCDTGEGKCNRGNTQIDWFEKRPAKQVGSVTCPDGKSECPTGNTCCMLSTGQYGCCPLPKAVCCADHLHCCPEGTTCDTGEGKCNRGNTQIDWFEKRPAQQVGDVTCPDGKSECPTGNTCCMLSTGQYGCCPLPKAVCCSDHLHCCPEGTTCDTGEGKCNRGNTQIDWFEKRPAQQVGSVTCPDGKSECPTGNTCCMLSTGQYGCCPLPKAVCCADHLHCCPEGTTCDTGEGKCNRGNTQIDWFEKRPAQQVGSVTCPDGKSECPTGNTCCMLSSGQYGCCPLPKAVCCADHLHCCPEGTTCDTGEGKCNRGNTQIDWFEKRPAQQVGSVTCPDGKSECPTGNTCCMLSSGQYGCCPLPKAVCCADHLHCCPEGTTCDTGEGKCNRGNTQIDWFEKRPAQQVGSVTCPDGKSECPTGNTCCMLSTGQYGCCPLPKAVCCADHLHCCPEGTTCDTGEGKCNRGNTQIDWFEKRPAQQVGAAQCPDGQSECPTGSTCCKLSSGQYGCCPMPKAVCCSDHVHCCPTGYTCEVSEGKCMKGNMRIDWFEKQQAILTRVSEVTCPDGSMCEDGQTCCPMGGQMSSYGCCPMPKAVCCSDGQHCCPQGYRCDMAKSACVRGKFMMPWLDNIIHSKSPASSPVQEPVSSSDSAHKQPSTNENGGVAATPCPTGVGCPTADSCCSDGKDGYLCCPYPKGQCCADHQHCCPPKYICDQGPNICRTPETSKTVSDFLLKLHAKLRAP